MPSRVLILLAVLLVAAPAPGEEPPPHESAAEALPDLPHVASEPPLEDDLLLEDAWLEEAPDPLERGNRVVFWVNEQAYRWVLDPFADAYEFVTPRPVRNAVRRFFANLREPANVVNGLFQLRARQAGRSSARFLVNSTVGLAGLFDPARAAGLEPRNTDFGQTLALHGVGDGVYLVLPLFGPANLRDAAGSIVDAAMRPDIWLLASGPQLVLVTSDGISGYESRRTQLEELRKSSFDFYVALRSAYRLDRAAQIEALLAEAGPETSEAAADAAPGAAPETVEAPRGLDDGSL